MSLRRSTRIQQTVKSPTSIINDSSATNVQYATNSALKSNKGKNNRNIDIKSNNNTINKSGASKAAIEPKPQYSKRRRLNTSEVCDDTNERPKGKKGERRNVLAAEPYNSDAPQLSVQQTPGSIDPAGEGSRRDGVVETAMAKNKVMNKDTVAAATTDSILEKANAYLVSQDPGLADLIQRHPCEMFSPAGLQEVIHPFQNLVTGIMAQQACTILDFL